MARFRDIETVQKLAAIHASIHNHSHGKWLVKGRINSVVHQFEFGLSPAAIMPYA